MDSGFTGGTEDTGTGTGRPVADLFLDRTQVSFVQAFE